MLMFLYHGELLKTSKICANFGATRFKLIFLLNSTVRLGFVLYVLTVLGFVCDIVCVSIVADIIPKVRDLKKDADPYRPILPIDCCADVQWVNLTKVCWHENPSERPTFSHIHNEIIKLANFELVLMIKCIISLS